MEVRLAEGAAYRLQVLARHQMIERLLADIAADATVCRIEGWDPMEYIEQIRGEMDRLPRKVVVKEEPNGCEMPKSRIVCSDCGECVGRFERSCPSCGAEYRP